MLLCARTHITDLLLEDYVRACEEKNPGLVERTIADVSREILSLLAARYPQPWPKVPDIIRYIASVVTAYRVVEAITTLVDSESASDNEWIPLQKQWKYCTDLLADYVKGKARLEFEAVDDREDASVAVVSPEPYFDLRGF